MKTIFILLTYTAVLVGQVPYERILHADSEPGNWLTYAGGYQAHSYSPLDQINTTNISGLKIAWMYQIGVSHHFETEPLVFDGVMYITEPPSDVTALDLRTGRPIWTYRRSLPKGIIVCCGQVNRGLAALDDQLFVGTVDAHVVALDMKSGRVRWDVEVADYKAAYSITAAPLVVKDKVIVGIAGAEYGIRGFLDAYDAKTGKRAWRFWTVPGPGEPGNETWSGDSWKTGGAPTWVTGAYDPQANLVYWGTGNPGPDFVGDDRQGDNLYSDSIVALDADTGKLKWYFQFTPHDVLDMDADQVPVLLDAEFRGRPRKLVLFANRNGFYYVLDRLTGEFLVGKQFARQNWAKGLDDKGRPIWNPEAIPSEKGALVYPDDDGTANWFSPSLDLKTGLLYQNVREKGAIQRRTRVKPTYESGRLYMGASRLPIPGEEPWGALRALDWKTGDTKWEFRVHTPPWCGVLSTAGNLVFSGTMEGDFFAVDAVSGKLLWRIETGGAIWANPISYLSEGKQYIVVSAGSSVIAFSLGQ
ncbi:MAG TPA: PQQ-dependent dehydrogenase, methanol/ethanol family [Bryobacteraceae bacterium]|nr:PQQ-dependent dehydrogenase, methanol/ethanol family [Bryobacteraceae bacterium]